MSQVRAKQRGSSKQSKLDKLDDRLRAREKAAMKSQGVLSSGSAFVARGARVLWR